MPEDETTDLNKIVFDMINREMDGPLPPTAMDFLDVLSRIAAALEKLADE